MLEDEFAHQPRKNQQNFKPEDSLLTPLTAFGDGAPPLSLRDANLQFDLSLLPPDIMSFTEPDVQFPPSDGTSSRSSLKRSPSVHNETDISDYMKAEL